MDKKPKRKYYLLLATPEVVHVLPSVALARLEKVASRTSHHPAMGRPWWEGLKAR